MSDLVIPATGKRALRQLEFYSFSILAFAGKSYLLVRLPYRPWYVNTVYTLLLLSLFYFFFRLRQGIVVPPIVVMFLAAAVGVDVLGNYLHLYGHPFGPLPDYDDFAHLTASGFSLVPTMWLLRTATRRMGFKVPANFLSFISVSVTFSFAAYYEILELWDEVFWGDFQRIWGPKDTANDLQFDLLGIVVFAILSSLIFKLVDRFSHSDPADLFERTEYASASRE
jgi:uncharacterized membrane protein YjdF